MEPADPPPKPPWLARVLRAPADVAAWSAYAAGAVLRALYVFVWHRMPDNVYSDMLLYFRFAQEWNDPKHVGTINDTLYPPGTSLFFGALLRLDPHMRAAMAAQLVIACAIPLVLWAIGKELLGRRAALLTLACASLYFPLFDHAGYLLAENPFTLGMLVGFWLLVRAVNPARARVVLPAFVAGVCVALAASFKTVALVAALFVVIALAVTQWRSRRARVAVLAAALGAAAVLTPLAIRATRLSEGRFCFVANESSRGILLGHHGHVFIAQFDDRKRGFYYEFGCPAAHRKGWNETLHVNGGPWDNTIVVDEAWRWTKAHPWWALGLSFEHIWDLWATPSWPSCENRQLEPFVLWSERAAVLLFFLPAVLGLAWRLYARRKDALYADLLLVAPFVALAVSVFFAIGEARYRVPFDGFAILLAARTLTRS